MWDYTWTINTSGMRQNTTFYIMYCEIIHELLIHQGETEHNILYNVLWDYTWTINTSGWERIQYINIMYCEIIHELLYTSVHETEHSTLYIMYCEIIHELLIHQGET